MAQYSYLPSQLAILIPTVLKKESLTTDSSSLQRDLAQLYLSFLWKPLEKIGRFVHARARQL